VTMLDRAAMPARDSVRDQEMARTQANADQEDKR